MLQVTPEVDSLESSDRIERIIRIGKSVDSSLLDKAACTEILLFFYAQRWHSPMKYLCHTLSLAGNVAISVANWHHHRNRCRVHSIPVAIASMTFPIAPMMHVLYSSPKVSFFRKNLQASGNSVRSCLQSLSYSFVCWFNISGKSTVSAQTGNTQK